MILIQMRIRSVCMLGRKRLLLRLSHSGRSLGVIVLLVICRWLNWSCRLCYRNIRSLPCPRIPNRNIRCLHSIRIVKYSHISYHMLSWAQWREPIARRI